MTHTENRLGEPSLYMESLHEMRRRNRYAYAWPLRLEKKTNRHRTTGGCLWGWYEIHPLGIEVGYWNEETGRDDLMGVDIDEWNERAWEVSKPGAL